MENSAMALSRENFKYIIVGCVVVIVGFILMSGGGTEDPTQFNAEELFSFRRITLAPFLVMLGYGVVLFGILKRPKKGGPIQNSDNMDGLTTGKNEVKLKPQLITEIVTMYCKNCGSQIKPNAMACLSCGCDPKRGNKHCRSCGAETNSEQVICIKCGVELNTQDSESSSFSSTDGKSSTTNNTGNLNKQRHGLVTAWLILILISCSLSSLQYLFAGDYVQKNWPGPGVISNTTIILLAIGSIVGGISALLLLNWKKIGFWGYATMCIAGMFINISAGLSPVLAISGLVSVALLYGILKIKKNNVSAWDNLH